MFDGLTAFCYTWDADGWLPHYFVRLYQKCNDYRRGPGNIRRKNGFPISPGWTGRQEEGQWLTICSSRTAW